MQVKRTDHEVRVRTTSVRTIGHEVRTFWAIAVSAAIAGLVALGAGCMGEQQTPDEQVYVDDGLSSAPDVDDQAPSSGSETEEIAYDDYACDDRNSAQCAHCSWECYVSYGHGTKQYCGCVAQCYPPLSFGWFAFITCS